MLKTVAPLFSPQISFLAAASAQLERRPVATFQRCFAVSSWIPVVGRGQWTVLRQTSAAVEKRTFRVCKIQSDIVTKEGSRVVVVVGVAVFRQLSQPHASEDCRTTLTLLLTDSDTTKMFLPISLIANYLGLSAVKEVWQSAP